MKTSLPDVNVWLALSLESHPHYSAARSWFEEQAEDSVLLCRVTQMSLLRLLSSRPGSEQLSPAEAWDVESVLRRDPRVVFASEPAALEASWRAITSRGSQLSGSSWTDAYLAAFAQRTGSQLVTFDSGFQRGPEVESILLTTSA